jgi:hypothetical protein
MITVIVTQTYRFEPADLAALLDVHGTTAEIVDWVNQTLPRELTVRLPELIGHRTALDITAKETS